MTLSKALETSQKQTEEPASTTDTSKVIEELERAKIALEEQVQNLVEENEAANSCIEELEESHSKLQQQLKDAETDKIVIQRGAGEELQKEIQTLQTVLQEEVALRTQVQEVRTQYPYF